VTQKSTLQRSEVTSPSPRLTHSRLCAEYVEKYAKDVDFDKEEESESSASELDDVSDGEDEEPAGGMDT